MISTKRAFMRQISSLRTPLIASLFVLSMLNGARNVNELASCSPTTFSGILSARKDTAAGKKLLIAIPFTEKDLLALTHNLEQWRALGPACTLNTVALNRPDLWFYFGQEKNRAIEFAFDRIQKTLTTDLSLGSCFARTRLVSANLNKSQDGYPEGINLMFYRLVMGQTPEADTIAFHSVFWMEPDVVPIKSYWVDKLVAESSTDQQFWVKGSLYMGDMFDGTPAGKDWQWIGHINGNAIYRLNTPDFVKFLQLVIDMEPPSHFWKPFDVSIWKVLHDRPYFWHIYQRIAKRFVYADFLDHWGFTLSREDVEHSRADSRVFFVHGNNRSAGTTRFEAKFKQARSRARRLDEQGLVDPSRTPISVFIRADALEIDYVAITVLSVTRHMPGALEIVLAVPLAEMPAYTTRLGAWDRQSSNLRVVAEEPIPHKIHDRALQEVHTRSIADTYCQGNFILQLPADCVLMRTIYHKDLFFAGKPLVMYDSYDRVPLAASLWQASTTEALGHEHDMYVSSASMLFPRSVYARMRARVEDRHAHSFQSFIAARQGLRKCLARGDDAECLSRRHSRTSSGVSLPAVAGGYMWSFMRDQIAWIPHNRQAYHRETFVPIIFPFVCQGNAWLASEIGQTADDINALQFAVSAGSCKKAQELRRPWAEKIVRYVG